MKKTADIIILIVLFSWSTVKDLDNLIRATGTTDYYIFSTNNLAPLFFLFAVGALMLDAATVFYLFRPRPAGFYTALASPALSLVQGVVGMSLALADLPGVKNAYAAGREARGLPVRKETLDLLFTPTAIALVLAAMALLTAVIALIVLRNRPYFFQIDALRGNENPL